MKEIPLTNYQLLAYFAPGFIVVFCFFICNEPICDWDSLKLAFTDLSIGLLIGALISAFIVGLILDGLRNSAVECLLDLKDRKKAPGNKVKWSFFYEGRKEDVALLYARYFTYYCFDFNVILALIVSVTILDIYSQLPEKWLLTIFFIVPALWLLWDGISLRKDIAAATNHIYPNP